MYSGILLNRVFLFSSRLQSLPFTGSSFSPNSQLMFENIFIMKIANGNIFPDWNFLTTPQSPSFQPLSLPVVTFPLPGYPGRLGIWLPLQYLNKTRAFSLYQTYIELFKSYSCFTYKVFETIDHLISWHYFIFSFFATNILPWSLLLSLILFFLLNVLG